MIVQERENILLEAESRRLPITRDTIRRLRKCSSMVAYPRFARNKIRDLENFQIYRIASIGSSEG